MNSGRQSGIAGVVERVDADDDVARAEDFGPAERQREEDRVARRHVGRRNVVRRRDRGRAAPAPSPTSATSRRSRAGRRRARGAASTPSARATARAASTSRACTLAVADGQRVQRRSPRALAIAAGGVRIEAAAQQDDRAAPSDALASSGRPRCTCAAEAAAATGRRSASIHSDSVFAIEHAVHRREQDRGGARRPGRSARSTSRANS